MADILNILLCASKLVFLTSLLGRDPYFLWIADTQTRSKCNLNLTETFLTITVGIKLKSTTHFRRHFRSGAKWRSGKGYEDGSGLNHIRAGCDNNLQYWHLKHNISLSANVRCSKFNENRFGELQIKEGMYTNIIIWIENYVLYVGQEMSWNSEIRG